MASIGLASPMVRHYRKIEALFEHDTDVAVIYDAEAQEVRLYVRDDKKAQALERIIIPSVEFGSCVMHVTVYPPNEAKAFHAYDEPAQLLDPAFEGNKAVNSIVVLHGVGDTPFTYVLFRKEVVQYDTDDIGDLHGVCSTLYEEIARDVLLMHPGVFYCTDVIGPAVSIMVSGKDDE